MQIKRILFVTLLLAIFSPLRVVMAQDYDGGTEYGVSIDTSMMLIGDQQRLTFFVVSGEPLEVSFPNFTDTIVEGVEVISGPNLSSSFKRGIYIYQSQYIFTAFDAGIYAIPPQNIEIEDDGFLHLYMTDTLYFAVNTYEVDLQQGMADIESPYGVPHTFWEIFRWILGGILLIAVILAAIYLIRRYRSGKPIFSRVEPQISSYEKAVTDIALMKEKRSWRAGNEKPFYTDITDILRRYLSGELGMQCMESTSDEILESVRNTPHIDDKGRNFMSDLLSVADLVKFAKMIPPESESYRYFTGVSGLIDDIHSSVAPELEAEAEVKGEPGVASKGVASQCDDGGEKRSGGDERGLATGEAGESDSKIDGEGVDEPEDSENKKEEL